VHVKILLVNPFFKAADEKYHRNPANLASFHRHSAAF
jgi:hypothetical protein